MKFDISKLDFTKSGELVPAIVQNAETLEVLMLGFMNKEAMKKTILDGKMTFFSRSKNRLWQKGETSGNFLKVVDVKCDCDNDTLLFLVTPNGPVCHTGESSCFLKDGFNLLMLYKLIKERRNLMPKDSYTSFLFDAGLEKILEKVEEESKEVLQAAKSEGKQRLIEESCDLIYHLFVLLNSENIGMEEIEKELKRRREK